jgi:hypothetical protein
MGLCKLCDLEKIWFTWWFVHEVIGKGAQTNASAGGSVGVTLWLFSIAMENSPFIDDV